jgi:putative flippase GtrA
MRRLVSAHWRQFAVFVAGGLLCALVDVGLMQLLLNNGVHYASATTAGFAAATPFNFVRFMCVVAINYLLTMACVSLSIPLLGNPLYGKILSLPLVALNGFVLSKYWIFK